ncbi:uncharacterized protein LOC118431524 [Branchiostoma floridae]|uniref:Uncharacterized protein LOC118431524 n=1 Tax=Branchiostoma floridae TaxID=7739 RepID=A0A9J7MD19_BRAFL|nr:uncharacterized protein LOC118431524 [Branchiostoma floridae]
MQTGKEEIFWAVPRLSNADCIGPLAEVPLSRGDSGLDGNQSGMTDKEVHMSHLYGDKTDHKESTTIAEEREGQDAAQERSKTPSRIYEDTAEKSSWPTSGIYVCGASTDPGVSSRLYGNSEEIKNSAESDVYHGETISGLTAKQNAGTSSNDSLARQEENNHPAGTDAFAEVVTTELINPMYTHSVTRRATEEDFKKEKDIPGTDGLDEKPLGNRCAVVKKGMENPAYGIGALGAASQGTSETEQENHYENMDDLRTDLKDEDTNSDPIRERQSSVNDVPQDAMNGDTDNERSYFRRMFLTTFSRMICVLVIIAVIMGVVALTVVIIKTRTISKTREAVSTTESLQTSSPHQTMTFTGEVTSSATTATSITTASVILTEPPSTLTTEQSISCSPGNYSDCAEIYEGGCRTSGVYRIILQNITTVDVYCYMDTDGGGWTVIQRRLDGSVPFNRTWEDYKRGFGNKTGEHWLGNDYLHLLTYQKNYSLRVDAIPRGIYYPSTCSHGYFRVSDENNNFKLDLGPTEGIGIICDQMISIHSGCPFSTVDKNNNGINKHSRALSCAKRYGGGWWYKYVSCGHMTGFNQQWNFCSFKSCRKFKVNPKSMMLMAILSGK